jgi:tRNA(Ile2) C34 agmatinyltransferase TiaS
MGYWKDVQIEMMEEEETECPECERETETPGDLCFKCQFDQKMDEDD